jgi:hypothetical protein
MQQQERDELSVILSIGLARMRGPELGDSVYSASPGCLLCRNDAGRGLQFIIEPLVILQILRFYLDVSPSSCHTLKGVAIFLTF